MCRTSIVQRKKKEYMKIINWTKIKSRGIPIMVALFNSQFQADLLEDACNTLIVQYPK